jgi:aminoglycoside phosphotransferase (APT) family kinase protein
MDHRMLADQPRTVRADDALAEAPIIEFLTQHFQEPLQQPLVQRQFSGGASNLTFQIIFNGRPLILRCAPTGTKAKGAHDMKREFLILQALRQHYPTAPKPIAFCDDSSIIGRDFYLMQQIQGIIPRANLPKELQLTESQVRQLCCNVLDQLIRLHQIDLQQTGLNTLGKGEGYIKRQIDGWCTRFEKAKTWNAPSCRYVMDYLKSNQPNTEYQCFIHNDFRLDNVVLDLTEPTHVIGVLDWEMATVGDPLMDLGNTLAYWVQSDDDWVMRKMRRQPTHLPGMLTRREVVAYYAEKTGQNISNFTFYEVYGLFRLAVIAQQIYYRYHHRESTNPAFRHFIWMIHYLNWRCKKIIRRSQSSK